MPAEQAVTPVETIGNTSNEELIRTILESQRRMENAISTLNGRMVCLLQAMKHDKNMVVDFDVNNSSSFDYVLPIKSLGELKSLEERLKSDSQLCAEFKTFIIKLGEKPKQLIKSFCRRVLTNEVAMHCSWFGYKNNVALHQTEILRLFRNVLLGIHPKMTEEGLKKIVSTWLRYARQRHERFMKRKSIDNNDVLLD
ncbi:uncharacterized protein LOC113375938 [Ctenocephalides felis]|uniref:uncharacterized protein LOC113375935 n=1 Tax=Ctenocephalides felis TaxID=7515 RepID=UPI000E6E309D|nr:uncharacterized protein LOC113375935 [Ctenocephalides felis]XP_026471659.1 uncharacterized protein LOC113375938 [Ctenocephalides felis]